ncbi:MAG: hypothetical protein COT22_02820 [Ignavibacteria bacterium CG08_land_8_20_14_0_20_37_9]|nr:MAG: hypothetical protein AUJ54_15475 [Ignavibacteria bacterium CG1_02_37_35]PIS45905.1 MAG: hypothetical protein COT22_02820 [Ignavibacteria bacterium CG08_land_8_20_14_0_20_37_9]PIX93380.1 MAG: hypothetical protein COZ25_11005 [Ignavibacteria bacterium CG_4_10_14_3_um_filter_37_18]PJC60451.1 MAG: hypothetical protein CO025_03145 [Ignavibacteria bacterium CG_4_9_14_0_2_um_filter_37_13]
MLIPNKYENINNNLLVIGSHLISLLKKDTYNIEDLFIVINKEREKKTLQLINLDQYFNTLTFLWLADLINLNEFQIFINKDDTQKIIS